MRRTVILVTCIALVAAVAPSQIFRRRIQRQTEEKQAEQAQIAESARAKLKPHGAAACGSILNVGFHIQTFSSGLRAGVWYPTRSAESIFDYPTSHLYSVVAPEAPVADCEVYPLVVYSHGLGGCGTVGLFFTETLAREGFIVVGPDHRDSKCKVDQPFTGSFLQPTQGPIFRPNVWTPATYRDRGEDIRLVLDEMPRDPRFGRHIDSNRIGATGHSLGGYTIMGMVGGWSSWRDDRIKAALLQSPYVMPFMSKKTVDSVHVPVMYQGGTFDPGVTPFVKNKGGAYDSTNPPKFFADIVGANHIDWSDFTCGAYGSIPACVAGNPKARLIDEYGIAFFNRYLKGKNEPILERSSPGLADYRFTEH